MKKYTYSQFSFVSYDPNNRIPVKGDYIYITDPNHHCKGPFFVHRVFKWSNGNITVIGHIL